MSAERRVELRLHNSKSYTRGEVCAQRRRIHYADDDSPFPMWSAPRALVAAHLMLCECHASVAGAVTVLAVRYVQSGRSFCHSRRTPHPSNRCSTGLRVDATVPTSTAAAHHLRPRDKPHSHMPLTSLAAELDAWIWLNISGFMFTWRRCTPRCARAWCTMIVGGVWMYVSKSKKTSQRRMSVYGESGIGVGSRGRSATAAARASRGGVGRRRVGRRGVGGQEGGALCVWCESECERDQPYSRERERWRERW